MIIYADLVLTIYLDLGLDYLSALGVVEETAEEH